MVSVFTLNTTHVSMGGVFFLSVVITVFVRWISPPLLLSIFPPPIHKRSTSSLCILYGIYIVIYRLYESWSKLFSRGGVV